jgi:hypothetical protein
LETRTNRNRVPRKGRKRPALCLVTSRICLFIPATRLSRRFCHRLISGPEVRFLVISQETRTMRSMTTQVKRMVAFSVNQPYVQKT